MAIEHLALQWNWIPRLDRCCFKLPLRTGAIIIGVVFLIFGIVELLVSHYSYIIVDVWYDDYDESASGLYIKRMILAQQARHVVIGSFGVMLGILLIVASIEENLWALLMWLWLQSMLLSMVAASGIPFTVKEWSRGVWAGFRELLFAAIFLLVGLYFLLVVFSFYEEVREEEHEENLQEDPQAVEE